MLPLIPKISMPTNEPLSFKDGRVAAFYKGKGSIALAFNQRSILITNIEQAASSSSQDALVRLPIHGAARAAVWRPSWKVVRPCCPFC
eukprot:9210059-Pyramimonas_sp.AAC.1